MNKPGSVPRDAIPDILAYILIVNKISGGRDRTLARRAATQEDSNRSHETRSKKSTKPSGAIRANDSNLNMLTLYVKGN
jgi:hypothetical protein